MESTATANVGEDAVSQVLGKDKPGRLRGLGRGYTISKLAFMHARDSHVEKLEAAHAKLLNEFGELKTQMRELTGKTDTSKSEVSDVSKGGVRCQLLDWCSNDDIVVGEGELCSTDKMYKLGRVKLGPNAAAIVVKSVTIPEACLWRPTSTMSTLGDTLGVKIPWPFDKVILDNDMDSPGAKTDGSTAENEGIGRVDIYDWTTDDEKIGEGILYSTDPKEFVNGIGLGPNAAILKVVVLDKANAALWRPNTEMSVLKDALNVNIPWPLDKIQIVPPMSPPEETTRKSPASASNSTSTSKSAKQKCILLDCNNSGQIVAQGRVYSTNPTDRVHFVPLGRDATIVWVEVSKVDGAQVWRPNSEVEFISDAVGTTVAWPNDKIQFL